MGQCSGSGSIFATIAGVLIVGGLLFSILSSYAAGSVWKTSRSGEQPRIFLAGPEVCKFLSTRQRATNKRLGLVGSPGPFPHVIPGGARVLRSSQDNHWRHAIYVVVCSQSAPVNFAGAYFFCTLIGWISSHIDVPGLSVSLMAEDAQPGASTN